MRLPEQANVRSLFADDEIGAYLKPLFYIGLSATMLEYVELTEETKHNAILHINSKALLEPWKEAGLKSLLQRKLVLWNFKKRLLKSDCKAARDIVDQEDLQSPRFSPTSQQYFVYEITLASGMKLIGSTVHRGLRERFFEQNPLK